MAKTCCFTQCVQQTCGSGKREHPPWAGGVSGRRRIAHNFAEERARFFGLRPHAVSRICALPWAGGFFKIVPRICVPPWAGGLHHKYCFPFLGVRLEGTRSQFLPKSGHGSWGGAPLTLPDLFSMLPWISSHGPLPDTKSSVWYAQLGDVNVTPSETPVQNCAHLLPRIPPWAGGNPACQDL